ncbi:hypothetical protein GWK47_003505 [Chionoecetes opilio]|uniref:Uncharacterized protein n=1 Tax=Chionoecetes opilio TaxID=41210 RepID=A0A8J4YLU5_CHIOP|nr:hypothetical protein GWK47_003505 [Chionoecetes opilio]
MLCLTSTRDIHQRCRTSQTKSAGTGIHSRNIQPGHNIQQWRKLLGSSSKKGKFIKFLVEEWKKPQHREKLEGKELYVTCEQLCFKITKEQWEEAPELKSSQKEADTRLLLHALQQQNLGTSLSSSLQRIQTSWSCVWACATRSIPPVPRRRDEEPDKFLENHTLSRTLGAACVIH